MPRVDLAMLYDAIASDTLSAVSTPDSHSCAGAVTVWTGQIIRLLLLLELLRFQPGF